jgi:fluoroacetyl-CoA thioesterase
MTTVTWRSELRAYVRPADTAESFGDEFPPAASTPFVLGLAEVACHQAVAPLLAEHELTVGVRSCVEHLRPSPVGTQLVAVAQLTQRVKRRLYFRIEVTEGAQVVARVRHMRAITTRDRVLAAMERK